MRAWIKSKNIMHQAGINDFKGLESIMVDPSSYLKLPKDLESGWTFPQKKMPSGYLIFFANNKAYTFEKAGNNIYKLFDKDTREEVNNPKLLDGVKQIAKIYQKEFNKEFQNEIIQNRAEGNYKTNMYEEVNYFDY